MLSLLSNVGLERQAESSLLREGGYRSPKAVVLWSLVAEDDPLASEDSSGPFGQHRKRSA
jgi:hypothetical protein